MPYINILSPSEQVAAHLRNELRQGRWSGTMPGGPALAAELGVDGKTVWAALGLLEDEGLLESQGSGRPRRIALPDGGKPRTTMRIAILEYSPPDRADHYMVELIDKLTTAGHRPFFTPKTLTELGMEVPRIRRLVNETEADAWIVGAGSRDILEWFAGRETPAFALFGRRRELSIAGVGPNQVVAGRTAVRHLIALGHQRIVILVRAGRRSGGPGASERAKLEEMEAHGLPVGPYNLPDWEDSPEGLYRVLEELFRVTPPTALIIDEAFLFHAVKGHLAQRGILAPAHVSLMCTDPDPTFAWCRPSVAHIRWDHGPVVQRIVRWASNVARGKKDRRQTFTNAEFVEGGTIGRAP